MVLSEHKRGAAKKAPFSQHAFYALYKLESARKQKQTLGLLNPKSPLRDARARTTMDAIHN